MDPEAGLPQILTPWSDNETKLMNRIFPNPDSLCLNFGRTGVFQWNYPNSLTLIQTTEWPQKIAGDTPRRCDMGGITHCNTRHTPTSFERAVGRPKPEPSLLTPGSRPPPRTALVCSLPAPGALNSRVLLRIPLDP